MCIMKFALLKDRSFFPCDIMNSFLENENDFGGKLLQKLFQGILFIITSIVSLYPILDNGLICSNCLMD